MGGWREGWVVGGTYGEDTKGDGSDELGDAYRTHHPGCVCLTPKRKARR